MKIRKKSWYLWGACGFILLLLAAVMYYFIKSPRFPDHIPSSEKPNPVSATLQAQESFFTQFTRFMREGHGGLLIAKKEDNGNPPLFSHAYRSLDEKQFLNLIEQYAKQNGVVFTVQKEGAEDDFADIASSYRVEFKRDGQQWILVDVSAGTSISTADDQVEQYPEIAEPEPVEEILPEIPTGEKRMVIVIDDFGNNLRRFEKFIDLDFDITYSILPDLRYSQIIAERATKAGREVILHQPMQPKDWPKIDPGPGALMINDTPDAVRLKLESNLNHIKYAIGINNHMGSAYTQDFEGMKLMMEVLSERNMFFLDSKTAPGNSAKNSAKKFNVPYVSRNIFLDNDINESKIRVQLKKGLSIAKRRGVAIVLGHPYRETLNVLSADLPALTANGLKIVKISSLFP